MARSRGKGASHKGGTLPIISENNAEEDNAVDVSGEKSVVDVSNQPVPQEDLVEQSAAPVMSPQGATPVRSGSESPCSVSSVESMEMFSCSAATPSLGSSSPSAESNIADESASNSPGVEIPGALQSMAETGARFQRAPASCWAVTKSGDVRLNRDCSLSFSLDAPVSSIDVLEGLENAGIERGFISCLQFNSSSHTWIISFTSMDAKNIALGHHEVLVCGHKGYLSDCENRVVIVKIFESPSEMPDSVLIGRLSVYGKVFSFRRDKGQGGVLNGVRTARMRLKVAVPSVVRIAGCYIRIWHPGQPKTCRRCGAEGHLVASCNSTRCFNCEQPGHHFEDCDEPILCSVCLDPSHLLRMCPYVVHAVNVVEQPSRASYANVTKTIVTEKSTNYADAASRPRRSEKNPSRQEGTKSSGKDRGDSRSLDDEGSNRKSSDRRARHEDDHRRERDSGHTRESSGRERSRGDYRDRDRERSRDHSRHRDREHDRDRRRERDRSSDDERDRSKSCHDRRRDHSSDSSDDRSEWVRVRHRRR